MHSNEWMMHQKNEDFLSFVLDEDNKSFAAHMHRMFFREEFLCWCRYLDMKKKELRVAYYQVIASYWMEHRLGRLSVNQNLHFECYNKIIGTMMEMKRQQIRRKKQTEAAKRDLSDLINGYPNE